MQITNALDGNEKLEEILRFLEEESIEKIGEKIKTVKVKDKNPDIVSQYAAYFSTKTVEEPLLIEANFWINIGSEAKKVRRRWYFSNNFYILYDMETGEMQIQKTNEQPEKSYAKFDFYNFVEVYRSTHREEKSCIVDPNRWVYLLAQELKVPG